MYRYATAKGSVDSFERYATFPEAEMCSDACVQMAAVAARSPEAATTGAESKEAEEQSQGCANASASLDGGTEDMDMKERKLKEKEERAKKAEAEEARKRRAEERQLAKAKLGVVDAKSRIVEAKAAAEACKRMARPWPSGDWKSLLEHFKKELLVPILEAQGNDAGGLELNGRYGSWLGALLRAGCRPTERQVETLARQAAGPLLKDAMTFVEQLLEPLSVEASSTLVTALKRHGVEARLQRLAEVGAVGVVSSDSHMTLRPLRECAQRITQLPNWKAAESAENPVVADLVGRLLEPGVLDDVAELLRSEACTPYELALHAFPSRLLPLLSSSSEWPWPPLSSFSGETLEALVPALQWLLGLCETFPAVHLNSPTLDLSEAVTACQDWESNEISTASPVKQEHLYEEVNAIWTVCYEPNFAGPMSNNDLKTTTETTETASAETQTAGEFSQGSRGHPEFCKRPCVHFFTRGCAAGAGCNYCHAEHPKRPTSLDKSQRTEQQNMRRVLGKMTFAGLLGLVLSRSSTEDGGTLFAQDVNHALERLREVMPTINQH
eukprot:g11050.t1